MGNSTVNDGISTGAIPKVRKVDKTNESHQSTTVQEPGRSETNVKKENKYGEGSSSSFGYKIRSAALKSKSLKADTDMGVFIRRKRNVSSKSDQSYESTAKKPKMEDSPPLLRGTGSHCSRRKRHYELRMLNDEVADAMGPSTSSGHSEMKKFKRKCEKGKYPKNKRIGNKKCKSSKKVTSDDNPVKVIRKNSISEDEDDLLEGLQKLHIGEEATPPVDEPNEMPGAEPEANAATPGPVVLNKLAALAALNSLVVIKGLPMSLIHRYCNILTEYFQRYGNIQHIGSAKIYRDPNNVQMFATTVYFDDEKTATKALEMDNTVYDKSIIRVRRLCPFMDEIEEGRRRRRAYLTFEELGIHVATNPETREEIVIMEDGNVRYDWEYSGSDSD